MKQLVAIIAMFGFLLQTFSQVVIIADYYANKEYIAKNLCENRNKPKMHCNGKCYLKKKLAKEGKDQAPSPRSQKNDEVITLFYENPNIGLTTIFSVELPKRYYSYNELATNSVSLSIFHPPTV